MSDAKPAGTQAPHDASEKRNVLITPDGEELDLSIVGTARIDPDVHRPNIRRNRLNGTKFAIAGLLYLIRREQSIQFATVLTLVVIALSAWLGVDRYEWMFLLLSLGSVWVTECLNTAIEATINMGSPAPNAMAKVGKDVASTATLISMVVFLLIAGSIVLTRLPERLAGG